MIRTIVVEDEPFASRRICRLIQLIDPEFEICATAIDGKAALETIERTPCDLVITDIRMPVMDGIELLRALRERKPEIMTVIVSGFSDFAYVSAALRENAVDYLLKPISEEDMRTLLSRIRQKHALRLQSDKFDALAGLINKTAPRQMNRGELLAGAQLYLSLFCAGPFPLCENADMCPGAKCWEELSLSQLIAQADVANEQSIWEFTGDTSSERIVIVEAERGFAPAFLQEVIDRLEGQMGMPVSCAYHAQPVMPDEVNSALRKLRRGLERGVRIGRSGLIDIDAPLSAAVFSREDQMRAQNWLMYPSMPEMTSLQELLLAESCTQRAVFELFDDAIKELSMGQGEASILRGLLLESVSTAMSASELLRDLAGMCSQAESEPLCENVSAFSRAITEYLEKHYAEHITIQVLSTQFGYVPSYLSRLFQKELGKSPVEYLTDVRIQRAKELMDSHPEMLMRDVAQSIGFKNQFHFSRIFKKYEGINPTDYRTNK